MDFFKKNFFCRSVRSERGPESISILLLGLYAAGKTSILYTIKDGYFTKREHFHTIGLNFEDINIRDKTFSIIDVGGGEKLRPLWMNYKCSNAVIFVVDSTDKENFSESADEINSLLLDDRFTNTYLLVYANKQDLPNAVQISELIEELKLNNWPSEYWHIQSCSALEFTGLYEGLDWLYNFVEKTDQKTF